MDIVLFATVAGVVCALVLRLLQPRNAPQIFYVQTKAEDEPAPRRGGGLLVWCIVVIVVLFIVSGSG